MTTEVLDEADEALDEREEEISQRYIRFVLEAELADYTPVRGCIAIRPYGYAIWESIQAYVDGELKATGHKNAYFPLFIPMSFLRKEAQHVEGFAPELAVVTHGGGQKLAEELVVRPTSETIIYDSYRKWIKSWRDLPMLINVWNSVVRWEMRTRPFLRGMEFLWQEGHTAHATAEEGDAEARLIVDIYSRFIEGELAIPVYPGRKSEKERFAGADITYTLESLMQDGKSLQMGTSHNLGQNFGRAFDVQFQDRNGEQSYPWSTSWAVSTRLIGALVLVHSDSKGLILPPRVAPYQVVIVPIYRTDEEQSAVENFVATVEETLRRAGIRVEVDWRDNVRPGYKFNEWELKGVPLRMEIGPRDVSSAQVVTVRRDTREKTPIAITDLATRATELLETIQNDLFARAKAFRDENTRSADTFDELAREIEQLGGYFRVNWCGQRACEDRFAELKAKICAIPFGADSDPTGPCICCGEPADARVLVAKSY